MRRDRGRPPASRPYRWRPTLALLELAKTIQQEVYRNLAHKRHMELRQFGLPVIFPIPDLLSTMKDL